MRPILLASAAILALSQAAAAQDAAPASPSSQIFANVPESQHFESQLVGLDVYDDNGKYIGQIEDITIDQDGRTAAYVLSVGGILGIGEHYVAVLPPAVKVSRSNSDQTLHATMNVTPDQLKEASEFKYSGKIAAKACINILH